MTRWGAWVRRVVGGVGAVLVLAALVAGADRAKAQEDPFADGWTLVPEASSLRFQSVKNATKVESSSFATFSGGIATDGLATVKVLLDSVDTKVDLRNVRMRFLFFETFQYPEATITTTLKAADLADLPQLRRKTIPLTFTLDLHGVTRDLQTDVVVTMLDTGHVSVSSGTPISVATADFNLDEGITKLQEAAKVVIIPSATVTFDFVFAQNGAGKAPAAPAAPAKPADAALETAGNFDLEACTGRFEILSRTGNIYFGSGSARLDPKSGPLLDRIVDIITRCPGLAIEVAGHTDSDGSEAANQALSEARARSVAGYFTEKGIAPERFHAVGYGESRPVASNFDPAGKARNRRIEFSVRHE